MIIKWTGMNNQTLFQLHAFFFVIGEQCDINDAIEVEALYVLCL